MGRGAAPGDPGQPGRHRPAITARAAGDKNKASSFAAHVTLVDLFPSRADDFALQMKELGYAAEVIPFGMSSQSGRDVPGPPRLPGGDYSTGDIETAVKDTAYLDDPSKIKAEYWADGPRSEFPPGHGAVFAQAVSRKRGHSVDDDAKLFSTLGNALMDASIAAWWWKYKYDFVRPITGIREHDRGRQVVSWLGPARGTGWSTARAGSPTRSCGW
ncbi:MAG: hypothetical protein ACJ782_02710 [Actinomycetota bacterium]